MLRLSCWQMVITDWELGTAIDCKTCISTRKGTDKSIQTKHSIDFHYGQLQPNKGKNVRAEDPEGNLCPRRFRLLFSGFRERHGGVDGSGEQLA